jgi:hypothetical protein
VGCCLDAGAPEAFIIGARALAVAGLVSMS